MTQQNENKLSLYDMLNKSSIKFYSKEDLLETDNHFKIGFKPVMDKHITYTQDKKQLYKIIMKNYITFIKEKDDSLFYNIGEGFNNIENLEKVILFIRYNETLNPSEIIKKIKKLDTLDLIDIIKLEQDIIEDITFLLNISEKVAYSLKLEDLDIDEIKNKYYILLETIRMIKAIKYDYCVSSTASFDEKHKPKKVFQTKKLFIIDNSFYLANNKRLTFEDFVSTIDFSNKNKEYYTFDDVKDFFNNYLHHLGFMSKIFSDDYAKLILADKYTSYISNIIDNINDIILGGVKLYNFTHRKVLLPKNGVLLLINNEESFVESILLKEVYEFEINHIVVITKYKDGKEFINTFLLKSEKEDDSIVPYYYRKKEENTLFESIQYVLDFFKTGGSNQEDVALKYEVLSPTYWKYRNRGYKSENDTLNDRGIVVKREFEIEIAPFLRKINGQPSNDALKLAKRLGIILEDGYTIVKPHTRTYNSQK